METISVGMNNEMSGKLKKEGGVESSIRKVILEVAIKSIIFAICAGVLTTLTHMLADMFIFHSHGKPEFVSTNLIIYSSCDKILMGIGYYVLGRKIPVNNSILRSMTYLGLNWISNFVPQFMGLAFADGPIAEQAFRISDLVCDSIVLMLLGIILGILYRDVPKNEVRACKKKVFVRAMLVSSVTFPVSVMFVDQLMRIVYPAFSSSYVILVSDTARVPFLINFYAWFILSGLFTTVFYRLTEYNAHGSWAKFGSKYSLLLWSPVVLIMVLFGTSFLPTFVYTILFIGIVMLISWVNGKILEC